LVSRPVDPVGRRYAVYSQVRHAVAVEAARLLYTREFKEYFQAKREAARRQATTVLPSNSEIHHQLLLLADRLEGPERQRRLERMRRAALEVMILLAEFEPRLIGSTWTGHIRRGSDIDINLFSDHPQAVTDRLRAAGIAFELERVQRRKNGQEQEFVHLHATHPESRLALEVTLYPASQLAHPPLCSITGGPMARASLSQLRQLLEQTEAPPGAVESERLSDPLASQLYPLRLEELSGDFPELLACRGVTQNDNHHLDVYQHTLAVVERLHGYLDSGFNDFEPWSGALRDHFARPLGAGWSRASLLILSGLCHNLG
jgi:predicted nucleotidyltransferase